MHRTISRLALIITAGALLLGLILALDLLPFLRGGYGWQWPYEPEDLAQVLPLIAGGVVYAVGAILLAGRSRRAGPVLAWAILGAAILPLLVIHVRHDDVLYELFARTAAPFTTGQHQAGAVVEWDADALRDWPDVMQELDDVGNHHVALSPPGLPLVYAGLDAALDDLPVLADPLRDELMPYQCHNYALLDYSSGEWASAWFGMLMPLWAALAVLPLYGVARRLAGAVPARWEALWWPLVPALLLFAPTWNTLYPLLSLGAFWLLLIGLDRSITPPVPAVALVTSGALVGLLTFANLSTIPLLGLLGFYTLLHYALNERREPDAPPWTRPVIAGLWVGLGLALPWLLYGAASGANPLTIVRAAMDNHLDLERAYWPWLWLHSWEWALFCGLPLIALWLIAAVRRATGWRWRGPVLALALLGTLIVLVLSGTARGETGRVWLFFTPFVLIAAAAELHAQLAGRPRLDWSAITLAQAGLVVVLAATLNVIQTDYSPPPDPPGDVPAGRPAGVTFGDALTLAAWDAVAEDGAITLRLDWEPSHQLAEPYWFSALLIDPSGAPLDEAMVWQPFDTHYPTTCWQAGTRVGETVSIPLPEGAAPGEWWISLAVLDGESGSYTRLTSTSPDGVSDTQVGLGPVTVP